MATIREALLVLDDHMRVLTANQSFYRMFRVDLKDTESRSLFELGNRQWDIPGLRDLLGAVAAEHKTFDGYQMAHDFPGVGRKVLRLNARHLREDESGANRILLAIEDVTEKEGR